MHDGSRRKREGFPKPARGCQGSWRQAVTCLPAEQGGRTAVVPIGRDHQAELTHNENAPGVSDAVRSFNSVRYAPPVCCAEDRTALISLDIGLRDVQMLLEHRANTVKDELSMNIP